MAIRSSAALLLAVAGVLLLATSARAGWGGKDGQCKPGCAECVPLTEAELAALKLKKEAKVAKWQAKKEELVKSGQPLPNFAQRGAGLGPAGAAPGPKPAPAASGRKLQGEDGRGEWAAGGGKWGGGGWGKWNGTGKWNHTGKWNGTGAWNHTKTKCIRCVNETAYELKEGRCGALRLLLAWARALPGGWDGRLCSSCKLQTVLSLHSGPHPALNTPPPPPQHTVCLPGYGWPLPPAPVNGVPPPKPTTPPTCELCPAGTASGPNAPKPDFAGLRAKFGRQGARRLLAADRKFGKFGGFCVPCPSGKSSADGSSCL